jgi:hypothetical protein
MPVQSCSVSFIDSDGIRHSAHVQAGSLYEAAVLAAAAFLKHGCVVPPAIPLQIEVTVPSVVHSLTMTKVEQWLSTSAKSPADRLTKERLKELLAGPPK